MRCLVLTAVGLVGSMGAVSAQVQIVSRTSAVDGARVHYLAAGPEAGSPVLFLHGAAFRATTWRDLGTLERVGEWGYRAVAVDLPGFGESPPSALPRETFLLQFMAQVGITGPVLISPSMSGAFSLPLLAEHPERLAGYVAVAPAGIPKYAPRLAGVSVPVLLLWGENDRIVPVAQAELLAAQLSRAKTVVLEDAGHACYMDQPARFHDVLRAFLHEVHAE